VPHAASSESSDSRRKSRRERFTRRV
jgi:hypothetical protein